MRTLHELPRERVEDEGVDPGASRSLLIMAVASVVFWATIAMLLV
jgi:hypothetical protein